MKARKIRYTIITTFLVLLFGAYIGLDLYTNSNAQATNVPTNSQGEVDLNPNEDIEFNTPPTSQTAKIPSDSIDLINYALDIYNNGKGSSSTLAMEVNISGTIDLASLHVNCGFTQHVNGNLCRNGKESLEEEWFYFDSARPADVKDILTDVIVRFNAAKIGYRAINTDQANDKVILVETKKADPFARTYDLNDATAAKGEWNYQDGINRFKVLFADDFALPINNNTVEIRKNDLRKDPDYVYIKVEYDLDDLPEDLDYYYQANATLQKVEYSSYAYEFKIHKKTGKLKQIIRTEKFKAYRYFDIPDLGKLTMDINGEVSYVQSFQTMDKAAVIKKPYLEYKK